MRIITHYPYITYESFNEPGDNPLAEAKTLVALNDEDYVQLLAPILLDLIHDVGEGDGNFIMAVPIEPAEPVVKVSEMGSPKAFELLQAHAEALELYEAAKLKRLNLDAFLEGDFDGLAVAELDSYLKAYQDNCDTGYPPLVYVATASLPGGQAPTSPPPPVPANPPGLPFSYYLHDGSDGEERIEAIRSQLGSALSHLDDEDFGELIGQPFYEVKLDCVLDPATGAVTIVSAARVK